MCLLRRCHFIISITTIVLAGWFRSGIILTALRIQIWRAYVSGRMAASNCARARSTAMSKSSRALEELQELAPTRNLVTAGRGRGGQNYRTRGLHRNAARGRRAKPFR
jgi:hypothetical protein